MRGCSPRYGANSTVRRPSRRRGENCSASMLGRIEAAQQRRGGTFDAETKAHLTDAADTLRLALAAPMQRQGL